MTNLIWFQANFQWQIDLKNPILNQWRWVISWSDCTVWEPALSEEEAVFVKSTTVCQPLRARDIILAKLHTLPAESVSPKSFQLRWNKLPEMEISFSCLLKQCQNRFPYQVGGRELCVHKELLQHSHICTESVLKSVKTKYWIYHIYQNTLWQESSIYPKNIILKISIFTKFTFSKSHFSQNSHFQSLIFYKNSHFLNIKFLVIYG